MLLISGEIFVTQRKYSLLEEIFVNSGEIFVTSAKIFATREEIFVTSKTRLDISKMIYVDELRGSIPSEPRFFNSE